MQVKIEDYATKAKHEIETRNLELNSRLQEVVLRRTKADAELSITRYLKLADL